MATMSEHANPVDIGVDGMLVRVEVNAYRRGRILGAELPPPSRKHQGHGDDGNASRPQSDRVRVLVVR